MLAFPELANTRDPNRSDRAHTDWAAWALTHDIDVMDAVIAETRVRVSEMLVADWRLVECLAFLLLSSRPERLDHDDVRRVLPVHTVPPSEPRAMGSLSAHVKTFTRPAPTEDTGPLGLIPMSDPRASARVGSGRLEGRDWARPALAV